MQHQPADKLVFEGEFGQPRLPLDAALAQARRNDLADREERPARQVAAERDDDGVVRALRHFDHVEPERVRRDAFDDRAELAEGEATGSAAALERFACRSAGGDVRDDVGVLHRRLRRERELGVLGHATEKAQVDRRLRPRPVAGGHGKLGADVHERLGDRAVEGERAVGDVEVAPVEFDPAAVDGDRAEELHVAAGLLLHEDGPAELDVEDGILPAPKPHVAVDHHVDVEREVLHKDRPRRVGLGHAQPERRLDLLNLKLGQLDLFEVGAGELVGEVDVAGFERKRADESRQVRRSGEEERAVARRQPELVVRRRLDHVEVVHLDRNRELAERELGKRDRPLGRERPVAVGPGRRVADADDVPVERHRNRDVAERPSGDDQAERAVAQERVAAELGIGLGAGDREINRERAGELGEHVAREEGDGPGNRERIGLHHEVHVARGERLIDLAAELEVEWEVACRLKLLAGDVAQDRVEREAEVVVPEVDVERADGFAARDEAVDAERAFDVGSRRRAAEQERRVERPADAVVPEQVGKDVHLDVLDREHEVLLAVEIHDSVNRDLLGFGIEQEIAEPEALAVGDGGFVEQLPLVAVDAHVHRFEREPVLLGVEVGADAEFEVASLVHADFAFGEELLAVVDEVDVAALHHQPARFEKAELDTGFAEKSDPEHGRVAHGGGGVVDPVDTQVERGGAKPFTIGKLAGVGIEIEPERLAGIARNRAFDASTFEQERLGKEGVERRSVFDVGVYREIRRSPLLSIVARDLSLARGVGKRGAQRKLVDLNHGVRERKLGVDVLYGGVDEIRIATVKRPFEGHRGRVESLPGQVEGEVDAGLLGLVIAEDGRYVEAVERCVERVGRDLVERAALEVERRRAAREVEVTVGLGVALP